MNKTYLLALSIGTYFLFAFTHHKDTNLILENELKDAIVLDKEFTKAYLKTSNGCGIGNFVVSVTGDSTHGNPSTLIALSDNLDQGYIVLDTIAGDTILGTAFKRSGWEENTSLIESDFDLPYVVISDQSLESFFVPYDFSPLSNEWIKLDSISVDGIKKVAKHTTTDVSNPIIILADGEDSKFDVRRYAYPNLEEMFRFGIHFEPEIFELSDDDLFISGRDTTGIQMLYHYNATDVISYSQYELNDLCSNAQEFLKIENEVFILSSPGDSSIVLTRLNLEDSALSQTTIHASSGARATHNEFKGGQFFTFQTTTDTIVESLNKQILILDPTDGIVDTFFVNLELDYFKHPKEVSQSFGFYELRWVGANWGENSSDTVYINSNVQDLIKFKTNGNANFINATFGCWTNVIENELDKIKFEFFPNPASSEITINLTGLVRGEKYNLDIVDSSGRKFFNTNITAYEKIVLPIDKLAKGIYFLKLDSGRNIITKKLVIQ